MFPVFCTASSTAAFLDAFLRETYEAYPEASQYLCIITTRNGSLNEQDESRLPEPSSGPEDQPVRTQGGGPMTVPSRLPWTKSFTSPFLGYTLDEVIEYVRDNFEETKPDSNFFAVLDAQSMRDRTAVVAHVRSQEQAADGRPSTVRVRAPFSEVNAALEAASIGEGSVEDLLEVGEGVA